MTDGRTYRPTDRPTDTVRCGVACTRLKSQVKWSASSSSSIITISPWNFFSPFFNVSNYPEKSIPDFVVTMVHFAELFMAYSCGRSDSSTPVHQVVSLWRFEPHPCCVQSHIPNATSRTQWIFSQSIKQSMMNE